MKKRYIIVLGFFILTCIRAQAQEIIKHEKRMFRDMDGKLYINKSLPLYLWVSTSPEPGSNIQRLESEESKAYVNPMYLDTEGYNTVRSPSAVDTVTKQMIYPETDIVFELYADSKPPHTHIDYGNVLTVIKEEKVFIGGLTSINLTPKDQLSGVQKLYYSLDSMSFKEYSGPIEFKEQGEYTLQFYAVDNVGNMEDVHFKHLILDADNPATTLEIQGDVFENILSARSSINLKASDKYGIKAIYYTYDDHPEKIYRYPLQAAYMSQGEHVLTYYSVDVLGNKEVLKTYNFYVDKTAPTIVQEIIGKSFTANGREFSSGRSKLKLTTFDNKAGVKEVYYSINGGEYQLYDKPFYLSNTSGNLSVMAYALDNVNNKSIDEEQSSRGSIPYIDLTGPALTYEFIGPVFNSRDTIYINSKTGISLKATDKESGFNRIEYSINNGDFVSYNKPFTIEEEGVHTIFFNGYDNVENSNRNQVTVLVDNSGPMIYSRFSMLPHGKKDLEESNYDVYPKHVVLFLSATDVKVGFDKFTYSLNGMPDRTFGGTINSFDNKKLQNIHIKAFDKLGNESSDSIKFVVE